MRCIDTHCHYNLEPLFNGQKSHFRIANDDSILTKNWQTHWQTAKNAGVIGSIVVGADLESSQRAILIHEQEPHLPATVGLHPELVTTVLTTLQAHSPELSMAELQTAAVQEIDRQVKVLTQLAQTHQIIAIGEVGCDYYHFEADDPLNQFTIELQKHLFVTQIKLANQLQLPLIIHTRDRQTQAYTDALTLIKEHFTFHKPFVLHCASGPLSTIHTAVALGGFVGFDGNLTYKNAQNLVEILAAVPSERIVVETDAPYLPPTPYRGQICEPWMVTSVATTVCALKNISEMQLLQNTAALFGEPIRALLDEATV